MNEAQYCITFNRATLMRRRIRRMLGRGACFFPFTWDKPPPAQAETLLRSCQSNELLLPLKGRNSNPNASGTLRPTSRE